MLPQPKPLRSKNVQIHEHNVKLEQFDSRCHLPSSIGVEMMNVFCDVFDNGYLGLAPSCIKSVCDCCSGSGNFGILCHALFPNLTSLHCVDIFKPYIDSSLHNYKLNGIGCAPNTVAIKATHANIAYFFHDLYYNSREPTPFDLITCNPPNLGTDAAHIDAASINSSDDSFYITLGDDIGRFVLDKCLLESYKCLKPGGFLFFTDTSLNNPNGETESMLENILNLKRNKDWIVVKESECDFVFYQRYRHKIKKEWIHKLVQNKRLFLKRGLDSTGRAHDQYIQKRRYILARKVANSKL
eukprot:973866_1